MAHQPRPILLFDPDSVPHERSFSPMMFRADNSPHNYRQQHHHQPMAAALDVDFRAGGSSYPVSASAEIRSTRRRRIPGLSAIQGPKSPSMRILLGSLVGLALGILLAFLYETLNKPEGMVRVSKWLQLPGHLFIRALNCTIIPMVLANTAASVADAVLSGRVRQLLGWRTMGLFLLSSLCSAVAGAVLVFSFQAALHPAATGTSNAPSAAASSMVVAAVKFGCGNATMARDASYAFVGDIPFCSPGLPNGTLFTLESSTLDWVLEKAAIQARTLSDHITIIVEQLVTDNLLASMAKGNLLSVIMVAVPIGVATAAAATKLQNSPLGNTFDDFLRCLRDVFFLILGWVVDLTPYAMVSIISGAILDSTILSSTIQVDSSQLGSFFADAVKLIVPLLLGAFTHMFIVLPVVFYAFVRANPFAYMKAMAPVYVFAAGASSSMATLPIAISTMVATKQVPKVVPQFVFPIATVVNMNASGIYMAMHVVFMAYKENYVLSVAEIGILTLVSLLASMGTPPIPNGGLIMILTIWNTVLQGPHAALPASFRIVFACDYLTDRIATLLNVNGNIMVTRIIAEEVDATVMETRQSSRHDGGSSTGA